MMLLFTKKLLLNYYDNVQLFVKKFLLHNLSAIHKW